MKKIVMASAVMAATAMAGGLDSRPAASVPTPVETREALNNVPSMSEKEKGDWQKLREERRAAREQILQDLRNKTAAEKGEMRDASAKLLLRAFLRSKSMCLKLLSKEMKINSRKTLSVKRNWKKSKLRKDLCGNLHLARWVALETKK